jgi:starvation-inducible DNA-binding protein
MKNTTPNIGISEDKRMIIAEKLSTLLAETYTLYLKTHKYHWNVTGIEFQTLHLLFEQQYTELAVAVDNIAERIRVMGVFAPGSYSEFVKLSKIKEDETTHIPAMKMVANLLEDHEMITRTIKDILPHLEGANDEGTNSLLGARIEYHEKTAWMLRSLMS